MVITFYTFNEKEATRLAHRPIKPQTDKEMMTRNDQAMSKNRSADVTVRLGPQG